LPVLVRPEHLTPKSPPGVGNQLENDVKKIFGKNLKTLRTAAGLSMKDLAEKLGVHALTVSRWEKSLAWPAAEHVDGLCQLLGASPFDLFTDGSIKPTLTNAELMTNLSERLGIDIKILLQKK
jgi:transcriptional regulator with XRE-family HTH domain